MRVFSRFLSFFAIWLLHSEWGALQRKLAKFISAQEGGSYDPPIFAQQLLISGEDHRFFRHGGIDLIAVCRAIWRRVTIGRREGASTIEMQIVRVVSGRYESTLRRKLREMALATLLTRFVPKEQLPALYLRIGYYGWRMNGFKEACQRLRSSADSLMPTETARLVARLKYPQPRQNNLFRRDQINIRGEHLLRLYARHQSEKTYLRLNAPIITPYETI